MTYTDAITPSGNDYRPYLETVDGDKVRAFVPKKLSNSPAVVWLIHAFGSSHDAILGGYSALAHAIVDNGDIAVCPNLGGSLWSSPRAQAHLKAANVAITSQLKGVKIAGNILVGTSHGGCLATYATGKGLLPNIIGLYLVNGVYDPQTRKGGYGVQMPLHYRLSGGTDATNPAYIPVSAFNVPIRLVYDLTDPTVNADANSKKFLARLSAAGKMSVSARVHNSEHSTPPKTPQDFMGFRGNLL